MDIVKLENVSLLAASGSGKEVNTTLSDETLPDDVSFHSRNFGLWDGAEE